MNNQEADKNKQKALEGDLQGFFVSSTIGFDARFVKPADVLLKRSGTASV